MVWLPRPPDSLRRALKYSHRYHYPLTVRELWFWQVGTGVSLSEVKRHASLLSSQPRALYTIRRTRRRHSRGKWHIARRVAFTLRRIPTLQAVLVTGSLAMNNTPADDDIDLMLITAPHSLWLTRFLVASWLSLTNYRRPPHLPEHSSPRVSGKICDNLYLSVDRLAVVPGDKPLYVAHEILQAKLIWDRGGVYRRFLTVNSWAEKYLPVAYHKTLESAPFSRPVLIAGLIPVLVWPLNLLLYWLQLLYMSPHRTREKIGMGFAYFHPNSPP